MFGGRASRERDIEARSARRAGTLAVFAAALIVGLLGARADACGFPAGALPPGSYRASCSSCTVEGTLLSCDCLNLGQNLVHTTLNVGDCRTDPANTNGELVCDRCSATGACCVEGAACSEMSFAACQEVGEYKGDNSTCDQADCPGGDCEGDQLTWVGGRSGAFGDPENWEPPQVPSYEEGGTCDTAVVDTPRPVTIDLSGVPASRLLEPRGSVVRRIGRLVVRESNGLRTAGGRLQLDALDPNLGGRSLEVGSGASLLVSGGLLVARHVAVGSGGDGEIEVSGLQGALETGGRLGVGLAGSGRLIVADGATVIAAEAVLGETGAPGSATVRGAASLLETGSFAVGLDYDGELLVEAGGKVSSETGVIDFNLDPGERGRAVVQGRDPAGNPSRWTLTSLDVGPRGSLLVDGGGRVEVEGPLQVGFEGQAASCDESVGLLACVEIANGQVNAAGVAVAAGGDAELRIGEEGALVATGAFTIGDSGQAGTVIFESPSRSYSVFTDLVIAPSAGSTGILLLGDGARLDLLGRFRVGEAAGSSGSFRVAGDPADRQATRISVLDASGLDSVVGAASGPEGSGSTGVLDLLGGRLELPDAGHDLVIERFGVLRARDAEISLHASAALVNRGLMEGELVLGGNYVQGPEGIRRAAIFLPDSARGRALSPLAEARFPRRAVRAKPALPAFGPLVVGGDAGLDGRVELQFGNEVAPRMGESFTVLDVAGATTGEFAEVSIRGLVPGSFDFAPGRLGGKLTLTSMTDAVALPAVSLKAKARLKEKAKRGGKIKLKRTGDTSAPLVVSYRVGGTARSGIDYEALPGTIEIPARKRGATIVVKPLADGLVEGPETIELELVPGDTFAPGLVSSAEIELVSKDR